MHNSLVLLKPDAFERKLVGHLLWLIEDLFVLERMEMRRMDEAMCAAHYAAHVSKDFYPELSIFMQSGPVLAIALSGDVQLIRDVCGTIRRNHCIEGGPLCRNLVHSSDSEQAADRELELWFPSHPLNKITRSLVSALGATKELIENHFGANLERTN